MQASLIRVWLLALAWPLQAQAAELTLAPGAPLTEALVGDLVRSELASRGMAADLAVDVRQPHGEVPNRAALAMRIALVDLRIDREGGRFQGRIEAVLPTGERT